MRIIVTGATGFLGGKIVETLHAYSEVEHVLATGRTLKPENCIDHSKVVYLLGDLDNVAFVNTLFKDPVDVVINCASFSSPWGSKEVFTRCNLDTQKNLVDASVKAGVKRFIYISTPGIYFEFSDKINIKENDPIPKTFVNDYAATKYAAEQLLLNSDLPYIILRPRALIGAGDTVIMPRLIRAHESNRLKVVGDRTTMVDLTSVKNMVDAVWKAIEAPVEHANEDYNISNGEPVNLWQTIDKVLLGIGYAPIQQKASPRLLMFIATVMELWAKYVLRGKEPILTRYSVGTISYSFSFDISKARERLGYSPVQTSHETLDEFVSWYKAQNDAS